MFYYLDGTVVELQPYLAAIDCAGVAYACATTNNTLSRLKKGERGRLYTYLHVAENAFGLYGFISQNELNSFKMLIAVSGVGPKGAIAILSQFTPEQFVMAVCTEDKKAVAKANGIGPKIAARIILELHDKLAASSAALDLGGDFASIPLPAASAPAGGEMADAQEALLVLGYNRTEILRALSGVDTTGMSSDQIIRAALKKLM